MLKSAIVGVCGDDKCPYCELSFGHGIPDGHNELRLCGNCKKYFVRSGNLNEVDVWNFLSYAWDEATIYGSISIQLSITYSICTSIQQMVWNYWIDLDTYKSLMDRLKKHALGDEGDYWWPTDGSCNSERAKYCRKMHELCTQ